MTSGGRRPYNAPINTYTTLDPSSRQVNKVVAAKLKGKPAPIAKGKRPTAGAILDANRAIVGVLDDRAAAKKVGVSHETVRKYRIEHNIPSAASRTQAASAPAVKAAPRVTTPITAAKSKPAPVAANERVHGFRGARGQAL